MSSKSSTSLTIYGGVKEIGGNKILVQNKDTRIFLDFGQSFSLLDQYFVPEAYLTPRERFGLRDYFALDLMPRLEGLYSMEALQFTDMQYKEPQYDAVFLSHPHMDHFLHMKYLDPNIPIYMGETAERIIRSTEATTSNKYIPEGAKINTFRTGKRIRVGSIDITPVHVDHSVPGAYGFLIDTGEERIIYTGDIRQHGHDPEKTEDFLSSAEGFDSNALIIEGTRVAKKDNRTNHIEPVVVEESRKIAKKSEGLILCMRYPKDMDRFMTFYSIAKETGKEIIISPKTAHLLLALAEDNLGLPNPLKDSNIKIFMREKKTYYKWEKDMMQDCVNVEYIHKNQESVMLELDSYYMAELVDIKPKKGDIIHSMSEPFEEDPVSAMVDEVLHNWAARFNMNYHQLHASGHAAQIEIFNMVERMKPGLTIPVHTKAPHLFRKCRSKVKLAKKGVEINID